MVLVQSILRSGTHTFHSIDEESRVKRVGRPWKKLTSRYHPILAGSCNGLLLIIIDADLFLWNHVTRFFKKVLSYELIDKDYPRVSGLCYDSSTNEYKALMVVFHESPAYGGQFVVVGSFRSKNWRRVRFPYEVSAAKSGPVVNGHLHWYASRENSDSHEIVYFNPRTNIFIEVPMPEPRHEADGNLLLGLGVLDGCLSMVRHNSPSSSEANSVEVLVMKECGIQKSWSTLFIISNFTLESYGYKDVPLCCTKYGEALMELSTYSGKKVRAYNLVDSSYKEILVQPNFLWVNAVAYEESLVTPTGYDWEEEELRGEPTYTEYYLSGNLSKWVRRNGDWNRE